MRNGASTGSDFRWMMSQAFHSGVGLEQHTLVLTWQLFINYRGRFLSFVPYSCNSLASYVGRRAGSLLFEDISHNKPELDMTFLSLLYLYWYFYFLIFDLSAKNDQPTFFFQFIFDTVLISGLSHIFIGVSTAASPVVCTQAHRMLLWRCDLSVWNHIKANWRSRLYEFHLVYLLQNGWFKPLLTALLACFLSPTPTELNIGCGWLIKKWLKCFFQLQ